MRIATYNIWNSDTFFKERIEVVCKAIKKVDADVVCLQEVRKEESRNIADIIANNTGYQFFVFREYPDCPDEGLAIMSKLQLFHAAPIWETDTTISNYCALRVNINYNGTLIGITNVHLNWRGEEIRKEQLNAVNNWIISENHCEKYEIMCGDFNDVPQSSIHDLVKEYGWQDVVDLTGEKNEKYYATFDLVDNHYLKEDTRPKEKLRFDWILINSLSKEGQFALDTVNVFGNEQSVSTIFPSDHYGLYADLQLD